MSLYTIFEEAVDIRCARRWKTQISLFTWSFPFLQERSMDPGEIDMGKISPVWAVTQVVLSPGPCCSKHR